MKTKFLSYAIAATMSGLLCFASASIAEEKKASTDNTKATTKPAAKPVSVKPATKEEMSKAAAKTETAKKVEAAKDTVKKIAGKPSKVKVVEAEPDDAVHQKLKDFAMTTTSMLDKHRLDGESRKQVSMVNGQYVARYCSIDKQSIQTSFKKPEFSNAITYVGYMKYHEVSYESSGKTKEEAMSGPFKEVSRQALTELVKYQKGRWTY